MARNQKTVYVCQQCGSQQPKWIGKCPECGQWNSMAEEAAPGMGSDSSAGAGLFKTRRAVPIDYESIESQDDARQSSAIAEFDRVLGGGIVPGSLVLIGGDPG